MRLRFLAYPILSCALAIAGCSGGPAPILDAGPPEDGGPLDRIPPMIRSTTPVDGEASVSRETELVVRFSEPMARDLGTIRIAPGGSAISASSGEWDDAGSTLTIVPALPWPEGEVTLTFESDFADLAGNALGAHSITFTSSDDVAPTVLETTPAEGAADLSARLSAIVIRFDEPMRTTVGTLDILGGAATLSPPLWSAGATTVTFGVADLEHEREYDVTPRGFVDANGNRLNGTPYLVDGVLDFATGIDRDGARVIRSEPTEGQLDVDPAGLDAILVTFDEVMDTTITEVTLSDGTNDVALAGTWTSMGRILRVEVRGLLAFGNEYALDLRMLRDRAGNAIDEIAYVADGRLDFTMGPDAFLPFVRESAPAEGETDVSYTETTQITVSFSEAMDTTVTTAPITGGPGTGTVSGTWTSATEIVFDVTGRIGANASMSLDLTGMRDMRGNALDAAHRGLADGRLDFTTGVPVGEGCVDPLTIAEATSASGGTYSWTISSLQAAVRDGGTSYCDSNGTTANGTDLLIRFDKVSPAVSAGGRYLRVVVDGSTSTTTGSNTFDVAVSSGAACDPAATPLRCQSNQAFQHHDLDLGAGPVWIWVSRTSSLSTAVAATITVSEVDAPRIEGDSCDAPFTTASAIYTAPTAPSTVHHFAIPANALRSVDIGPYSYRENVFSCDTAAGHGIDAVVRFDKVDDASVLRVSARRAATSGDTLNVEAFTACDATLATTRRLGCQTAVTTAEEFLVDAPAGPVYVWAGDTATTVSRSASAWVFNPAIDVDIEVIPDVQAGEICSRAHAAAAGANAVAGTSDQRLHAPSCFGATSNVEWYQLTTTQDVTFVSANAAGGLALLDPAATTQIACVSDGLARTLTRVLPVGTSVCIGVEMGRGITSIDVTGQDYDGLGSRPPVDLEIQRPYTLAGTAEESVTSEYWMAVSSSTLLMRHTSSAIMDVSRMGGERAIRRGLDDGVTTSSTAPSIPTVGRGAVIVGDSLFSFSQSTTAGGTSRVFRLWDGRAPTWSATAWDFLGTSTYPTTAITAAARQGTSTDMLYVTSSTATTPTSSTFYRISSTTRGAPTVLGTNTALHNVRGMVADDQFVYVSATVATQRGVYRIPLAALTSAPFPLARSTVFTDTSSYTTSIALDSLTAPQHLYVRSNTGDVEAIIAPASASPFYLGPVIDRGTSSDYAMTLDPATGQLFLFETETNSAGVWLRYDP